MPTIQDTADWPNLVHAYGAATNLPDVLEQLGSDDPEAAERAIHALSGTIYHQGRVYPATAPAVTVLYEFVQDPDTHHRPRVLALLSTIAHSIHDLEEHDETEYDDPDLATVLDWAQAAHNAVKTGIPTLQSLLNDPDPAVRAAAPYVLADFPEQAPDLMPRLQEAAATEQDAGAAASMILAIGTIGEQQDHPPLAWLRHQLQDPRHEVRAAAALPLLWCGANDDVAHAITSEIQAAASALDGQLWVEDGGRTAFLISGFEDRPTPQIQLARDALTAPNAHAVLRAGEVMRTWRAAPAELLPPLARLLNNPELAQEAVWQIKQGGPDISLITDALLPLLHDPNDLIAGSALEALARTGDARCVQALTTDLAEPHLSYNPAPALNGLKNHAEELLPPIQQFLAEPKKGPRFAGNYLTNVLLGLTTWGDHALPLLPEMMSLLEKRKAVPAAARALAALGPAAADAVPLLRRYLGRKHGPETSRNAAWAIWQITGDGTEPIRFLASTIRSGLDDEDAERLYTLGSAAEPALPFLDETTPGAAALIHRITGDTPRTLPHLLNAVAPTPTGMLAIRCLADLGQIATPAAPHIQEIAESPRVLAGGRSSDILTTDRAYQQTAETALTRIRQAAHQAGRVTRILD
ncbi:hypothetical protein GCM10022254_42080 [Actinomadura meridiana]|uniref:HEAT repeat domain-containing protein n=1 Tax=Actinomadura meridiana TaxID=559626 RepID=A0ABP8C7S0_9ACTN